MLSITARFIAFTRDNKRHRPLLSIAAAFGLLSVISISGPLLDTAHATGDEGKVTIFVVRHGETDWNQEGRIQGNTDNSLNAKGR